MGLAIQWQCTKYTDKRARKLRWRVFNVKCRWFNMHFNLFDRLFTTYELLTWNVTNDAFGCKMRNDSGEADR